jgi:menaquinone-dependent protoporphyrinogen oxidase
VALDSYHDHRTSFFFSVNLEKANRPYLADPGGYIADLVVSTSWRPTWSASFAGALRYREYSWPVRRYMRLRSSRHGQSVDAARDHELTDWSEVAAFADRIASSWDAEQRVPA